MEGGDPQGRAGKEDTKEQGSGGERNNHNKVCKQDSPSPSRKEIHQGLSGPSERLISHVASALLSLAPAEWDQAAQVKTGRETPVPRGQGCGSGPAFRTAGGLLPSPFASQAADLNMKHSGAKVGVRAWGQRRARGHFSLSLSFLGCCRCYDYFNE